jgi:glycosyltransferase involved in cell wall biosynthesis
MSSSKPPLVTVAIPTYNRASLLREALQSVLDQTLKDIEVFVSDNASTDQTQTVVQSFRDSRIRYERLPRNVGPLENMSRCLQLGTAPYLALLTDDDRLFEGSLQRSVGVLHHHPKVDLVHSAFELVFMGPDEVVLHKKVVYVGGRTDAIESGATVVRRLLTGDYWINPAVAVIRRSVIGDERFDPSDGIVNDLGICLRVARRCREVAYIADPLAAAGVLAHGNATKDGVYDFDSGEFYETFEAVRQAQRVKERFLAQFGHDFSDREEIRSASRRWARRQMLKRLKRRRSASDSPGAALRLFRDAARAEPGILLTRGGALFLIKGVAGRRGRNAVRGLMTRVPRFRPGRSR